MPTAVLTGTSRGIGRATAKRLAAAGWDVYAGVRSEAAGEQLRSDRIRPVIVDVTDEAQIGALSDALPERVDALVNNAGIVVGGPVEAVPIAELRRQIEVNLIGQIAVTQALLPKLRAARGRIVFVSSVSGRVATPLTGAYNASKFGLEGIADALRMEVAPWGIKVVIVEPAQTDTDMWQKADETFDETLATIGDEHRALYAKHIEGFRKSIPRNQKMASPVDTVTGTIERALTAARPKARYVVGTGPKIQAALAALTPTPLLDRALRAATGVPRKL
jgi:NAD(P)-dependent dehydrogenase (short-subunit alcohol dehydrogenase family)